MSESAPIAIIGISCLFPKADNLQAYWSNIKNGVDAITPIPERSHWNIADYFNNDPKAPDRTYAQRGGFISPVNFNPMDFGISPKDIEATDTTQLLGMVAAKQALQDAGYGEKPFNRAKTSVILGVTGALELVIPLGARLGHPIWRRALKEAGVREDVAEDVVQRISDNYVGWQENSFPGLLGNVAAGRIASRLDLGGTNCVVDAACASSMGALHLGCMELETGRADMVITGGLDTFNDIFMYMCFSKTPALSPTGDAKPFDRSCDGTILGEGLGILVLKRLADAERDGDRIYAVFKGIGSSSDGRGNAIYAPKADGQKEALERAYAEANAAPTTIDLVEAHGTGTKVGDATEVQALTEVYRKAQPEGVWAALGSVKSQIGHAKAASGVAGLIKAALSLQHKILPPTIKVTQPIDDVAPGKSPFYVNTQKRPWLPREGHPRRAAVSSFGFGGTNYHCVLEEHGSQRPGIGWDGDVEIVAFCGESVDELRTGLAQIPNDAPWNELRTRARKSREEFRGTAKFRLLIPISKGTAFSTLREAALMMLAKQPDKNSWVLPNGIAFGSGEKRGRLGALFPGQGSQYPGMLRDLACQFPQMLDSLADGDRVFASENPGLGKQRLSDFIYPHPAFDDETRKRQEEALKATDIAQPALGAVSLGALGVITSFGVLPEAVAGHSYGELSALCGAGRLESDSLHLLSNVRGRLMAKRNGGADRGAMLAVQASEAKVNQFLGADTSQLVIANRNSPSQFVLAGSTSGIGAAAEEFARQSIRTRLLPVAAAFHSGLVADARAPFAAALEGVQFEGGNIPVYANTTAQAYPACATQTRDLLAGQIVNPVDFMAQIEKMYADGVTTFIEVGPGHVLSDLVQAILQGRVVETIAMDSSRGTRSGTFDLAFALCRVAALGHPVDLKRWEIAPEVVKTGAKAGFTVRISGANVRSSKPKRPAVLPKAESASKTGGASVLASPNISATGGPAPAARSKIETTSKQSAMETPPLPSPLLHSEWKRGSEQQRGTPGPMISSTSVDSSEISAALQIAQQGMLSLQRLQEQTAELHRQFLENQDAARRTIENLMLQRRELLQGKAPGQISTAIQTERKAPLPHSEGRRGSGGPRPSASSASVAAPAPVLKAAPVAVKKAELNTPPTPMRQVVTAKIPASGPSHELVARSVLEVVAEKTGYPAEMLNLEMGLDSDLGVDSIKRVEIMAALRGRLPEAPEIKPEHLGTLQTLNQVVEFLTSKAAESEFNAKPQSRKAAKEEENLGRDGSGRGGVEAKASVVGVAEASEALLKVVAEKTGYPVEMLNLEMGLDSDLGVDSIKRVEIMAALRGLLPAAPEIKPEHLGTLQTLQQVVDFLTDGNGKLQTKGAETLPQENTDNAKGEIDFAKASAVVLEIVAEKTGYPVEMLNLEMGLDSDLGVDSIKRVEIMSAVRTRLPEAPEIKPEHLGTLQTLKQVVEFLTQGAKPQKIEKEEMPRKSAKDAKSGEKTSQKETADRAQPLSPVDNLFRQLVRPTLLDGSRNWQEKVLRKGAVVWVTEDGSDLSAEIESELKKRGFSVRRDSPAKLIASGVANAPAALVVVWPAIRGGDSFLKEAFQLIQAAGPSLRKAGRDQGGILISVSRLDGVFGFGTLNGKSDPVSGGLVGVVKTAHHEWPEVNCKAIDLDAEVPTNLETAKRIVDEMFRVGPVEVGLSGEGRFGLSIETIPLARNGAESALKPSDVVVVTGGARGITATSTVHLAREQGLQLVLLGRSRLAESESAWLNDLSGEAEIKKALLTHSSNGDRSPKAIEARYKEIIAQREIRGHLAEIRATGATAIYRTVDVRNEADIKATLAGIRAELGPIRGIIHGAGVLADRRIEDKTQEQFDLVYGTKVAGLKNLLGAVAVDELKVLALFSSYTGRFGRTGQVDYAAANEVLNKMAQVESRRRPQCRVVSFNWGPWNGGMVSEGLRKIFEKEGVGLIEPEAGARFFVKELSAHSDQAVEVLALAPAGNGIVDSGHGPIAKSAVAEPAAATVPTGSYQLAFEREVSVRSLPCLASHVLDGRAVLPAALMIEWLGHGAVHGNPGLNFHGFDDFQVLKGLVLGAGEAVQVSILAGVAETRDGLTVVPMQLTSRREGRPILHARAKIVLSETPTPALLNVPVAESHRHGTTTAPVYGTGRLFHGPHFQGIESLESCIAGEVSARVKSAPSPKQWMEQPLRTGWLADPLALDSSFQMMILWSTEIHGAPSLPCAMRRFRQYAPGFSKKGGRIVIRITSGTGPMATADIQFLDHQGRLVALAEGYECVMDSALGEAFRLNRL